MVGRTVPLHGKARAGCETHHQHLLEKLRKDLLCAAAKSGFGGRLRKGSVNPKITQPSCSVGVFVL